MTIGRVLERLYSVRVKVDRLIAELEGTKRQDLTPDQIREMALDYKTGLPTPDIVLRYGVTIDTLYWMASKNGWSRPRSAPPTRGRRLSVTTKIKPMVQEAPRSSFDVIGAEDHARHTLVRAGYVVEHVGIAKWKLNGVTVDRTLFVTVGYHVRTKLPLPQEWLLLLEGKNT